MDFEFSPLQKELQARAREFVQKEILPYEMDWNVNMEDWHGDLCLSLQKKQDEYGLSHLAVPKEYGGQGLGTMETLGVGIEMHKIRKTPLNFLIGYGASPMPIMYSGTEYQKEKYLWPVLRREKRFSFAFTEPAAGSDVKGMQTTAVKKGDKYIINGHKLFPTFAHISDFTLVCAYTDHGQGHRGMSMFFVDKGTPGWEVERLFPMFDRNDRQPMMKLENCEVPEENMIGSGKGFAVGMTQFNGTRLGIAAICLARSEMSLDLAIDWAKKRQAFDRPIGGFQGIQWMLADSKIGIETMKWLIWHTAWKFATKQDIRLDAAMVKVYSVETSLKVIDQCMQVFGGRGLTLDYPFADYYGEIRMFKSAEGTMEIMRHIMATQLLGGEITHLR